MKELGLDRHFWLKFVRRLSHHEKNRRQFWQCINQPPDKTPINLPGPNFYANLVEFAHNWEKVEFRTRITYADEFRRFFVLD
jgi:hypothetical protein